jgi:uncharacterized membrane protein
MTTKNITLKANNQSSTGHVEVLEFSETARIKRGSVALILGLLLTTASVFVPVLHIFLVPLGLIITIFISRSRFKTAALILSGQGTCPACQAPFRIMKRKYVIPFSDICEKCSRNIGISSEIRA